MEWYNANIVRRHNCRQHHLVRAVAALHQGSQQTGDPYSIAAHFTRPVATNKVAVHVIYAPELSTFRKRFAHLIFDFYIEWYFQTIL